MPPRQQYFVIIQLERHGWAWLLTYSDSGSRTVKTNLGNGGKIEVIVVFGFWECVDSTLLILDTVCFCTRTGRLDGPVDG